MDSLLDKNNNDDVKPGDRALATAGCFNLGECLLPEWDREMLYEDQPLDFLRYYRS